MGLYIKGMKMPESCADCRFTYYSECSDEFYCAAKDSINVTIYGSERHPDCPIKGEYKEDEK